MYSLWLFSVFLLIAFIYTASPAAVLPWSFLEKLPFVKSITSSHKSLGVGAALLVIFISTAAFGPQKLSQFFQKLFPFMAEYKPGMLPRKWNPNRSRQLRQSRESRLASKNGGEIGGLSNEGNTCFMNSVLQSLASSHSLMKFFNDNIYEDTEVHANGEVTKVRTGLLNSHMRFTSALKSLLDDLNGRYGSRGKEFSTRVLMKRMSDGPKQNFFMGYNQEDAQEFYQLVMRIVEKEYTKATSTRSPSPDGESEKDTQKFVSAFEISGYTSGSENLGQLGTVYVPAHQIDPNVPDSDNKLAPLQLVTPVDGISAERIGCITCGETGGIRYSVNSGLSLNLPYDRSYGTLYDLLKLLDEWKKPELIDDVNCNRCGLTQTRDFLQGNIGASQNEKLIANFSARIEEIEQELKKDYVSDEVFEKLTTKQMIRKTTKSKQILLSRPPPLLCIHINRSVIDPHTYMIMKNSKSVSFPAVLDLNAYVADPSSINMDARLPFSKRDEYTNANAALDGESLECDLSVEEKANASDDEETETNETDKADVCKTPVSVSNSVADDVPTSIELPENPEFKYQLKAVISHMGTHNYGHYICYRRLRGTWWKANDEQVYPTTEDEVLSSPGTFMLFYEMIDSQDEDVKPLSDDEAEESEKEEESEESSEETPQSAEVLSLEEEVEEEEAQSDSSGWRATKVDSEEERRELFPNAKFDMSEDRAYHV